MSKTPGTIGYPNLITDHHTVTKMREMIDGHNALKVTSDATAEQTQKNTEHLASLPTSFVSPNDVNSQITNWSQSPTFLNLLNSTLTAFGIHVPNPPKPQMAGAPQLARAQSRVAPQTHIRLSGPRADAPTILGPADAGLLYYVTDYAHLAVWDGWAWQLSDPGGYLVDSEVELGVGWFLCNGNTTDYILNDSPTLEIRRYTTRRHRSLSRHLRRFFRR